MTDLHMDPGLRELLGEIALDPRARLLRVQRGELPLAASAPGPRVSSSTPFLRRAERRLLEVYREEFGRLLYRYAILERGHFATASKRLHYADFGQPQVGRDALDDRNRALAGSWTRDLTDLPAVDLLRACLRQSRAVSPTQLSAACLRLAPAQNARIAHAIDLILFEQMPHQAMRLLHGVLAESDSGVMASYAWENMSLLELSPRFAPVALLNEKAVRADPDRIVPAIAWLRHSPHTGSLATVLRAAEHVEEVVRDGHPALEWYLQLELCPAQVTRETSRLARLAEDHIGPVARRVLEFALSGPSGVTGGIPAVSGGRLPSSAS